MMPSSSTGKNWQAVIDPGNVWLSLECNNGQVEKVTCKLCTKWEAKVRRGRNYSGVFITGVRGSALKRDNIVKHELSDQHRQAVRLEKGPSSVKELYEKTPIGKPKI